MTPRKTVTTTQRTSKTATRRGAVKGTSTRRGAAKGSVLANAVTKGRSTNRNPPRITSRTPIDPVDVDLEKHDVRNRSGRRITEDYVDDVVAAARKVGRPAIGRSTGVGRSPQVTFRVAPALRTKATEAATRQGKSLSEFAREALEEKLSR